MCGGKNWIPSVFLIFCLSLCCKHKMKSFIWWISSPCVGFTSVVCNVFQRWTLSWCRWGTRHMNCGSPWIMFSTEAKEQLRHKTLMRLSLSWLSLRQKWERFIIYQRSTLLCAVDFVLSLYNWVGRLISSLTFCYLRTSFMSLVLIWNVHCF